MKCRLLFNLWAAQNTLQWRIIYFNHTNRKEFFMKFNATILSIAATLALAACGGGGDSVTTNGSNTTRRIDPANINKATYQRVQDATIYSVVANSNSVANTATRLDRVMAEGVIFATNIERARKGAGDLVEDPQLTAYAQRRAEEISRDFEHRRPGNTEWHSGLTGQGAAGENLAYGFNDTQSVIAGWKNSPGHYRNMISTNFTKIGVGLAKINGIYYWVQIFGNDNIGSFYTLRNGNTPSVGFERLSVDNITIPLASNNLNGSWQDFSANVAGRNYNGTESGYDNVKFGLVRNNDTNASGAYQTFYQGRAYTGVVPTSGRALYNGTAVWVNNNGIGAVNNNLSSRFSVDFANRTIDGNITNRRNGNDTIQLSGKLDGANFHSAPGSRVEMHGQFYGNNAEALAGDFREHPGVGQSRIGAFGAVKQ